MSIGLQIAIEKSKETDTDAEYVFLVREGRGGLAVPNATGRPGRVRILKATGEVTLIDACPDEIGGMALFGRVVAVLKRHWRAGEYPSATWWAA